MYQHVCGIIVNPTSHFNYICFLTYFWFLKNHILNCYQYI